MPPPYAYGIFGVAIFFGYYIFTLLTSERQRPHSHSEYGHSYHAEPRNNDWGTGNNTEKEQKTKSKKPLCEECDEPLERYEMKRFSCKVHIFHDYCVQGSHACPSCGSGPAV